MSPLQQHEEWGEITPEPLTDVESLSNWLAIECDGSKVPPFLRPRRSNDPLDGVELPLLLALAFDTGIHPDVRVRAIDLIGDAYLAAIKKDRDGTHCH